MREAGLNRALFEMANIRDQCSWVHMHEPQQATDKARDLVRMAVAKAAHLRPLEEHKLPVTPSALLVGGGLAGMTAALTIAGQGYETTLIERDDHLGGQALKLDRDRFGGGPAQQIRELIGQVEQHPQITVLKQSVVASVSGYVGNFTTTVSTGSSSQVINHGVAVLATGGKPYQPQQYLHGASGRVVTQLELEERLASRHPLPAKAKQVVMMQCVGSRGDDLSYCSRVCCGQALKNSLRLKQLQPDLGILVFYRDMRAYGFMEDDYRAAREQGVIFIRYTPERPPQVNTGKGKSSPLGVTGFDPLLGEEITVNADLVVLSVGIVPENTRDLALMLKVPVTADNFYLEAHVKLRPVDLPVDGVFTCGLAHSPQSMAESIAQAQAAAGRACQPLARGYIAPEPIVSSVDQEKCIGCGACQTFCPYKAIEIFKVDNKKKARTITASCKGCGVCSARCPTMAIDMGRFTLDSIMAQIGAFTGTTEA